MNTSPTAASASADPCDAVSDRIRAGVQLDAGLATHAASCETCGMLMAFGQPPAGPPAGPDLDLAGLQQSLDGALAEEKGLRAWLRERPTRVRVAFAAVGALVMPLFWLVGAVRPDLSVYPAARLLLDLTLFVLPIAVLLPLVVRPMHRRALPGWVRPALVVVAVIAVLVFVSLPIAHWDHPESRLGIGDDLAKRATACFTTGFVSGLPILIWVWLLSRRGGGPWPFAVLATVLAGMVGVLAVFLHCPLTSPVHLTLGHATVVLPFIVLALLGRARD